MLKSEQNTNKMHEEIKNLAKGYFDTCELDIFFEHGQWWVRNWSDQYEDHTYSVVDADPGIEDSGLDFEEI